MKYWLILLILLIPSVSRSATYYVAPSGSGSACSAGSPCSLSTGFSTIISGDTLVLTDGTYTGTIYNPISGSEGAYTTIRAENDGMAVVTSTTANAAGQLVTISGSYIRVEGIKFVANGIFTSFFIAQGAHHNKILRCAFVQCPDVLLVDEQNNIANAIVSGDYNLMEDCWAWGGGRYKMGVIGDLSKTAEYNIFRRCVVRHDRSRSNLGQAGFINYTAKNTLFQNCISIDSDQTNIPEDNYNGDVRGSWFFEKGGDLSANGPITMRGNIALNYHGAALYESNSDDMYNTHTVTDFIAWDGNWGLQFDFWWLAGKTESVDHATIGDIDGVHEDYIFDQAGWGSGVKGAVSDAASGATVTNSILYSILRATYTQTAAALYNVQGSNDYNSFYSNTVNRTNATTGAHDITDVNPLTNSLLHLPRIASGGTLKGAGSGGSDIGATVMYRWGTSGSAYGESGYDTITTEPLWPWPNEDRIKADMSSYPSNWPSDGLPNPVRGFTAYSGMDGVHNTLTTYIWEYLGNQIPAEIYGTTTQSFSGVTQFAGCSLQ